MVEFTVAGIPCIGLNGGPAFKHNEAFWFQIATDDQHETDRYWNAIVGKWRAGKRVRLVQRQVGRFLANHAARADSCPFSIGVGCFHHRPIITRMQAARG